MEQMLYALIRAAAIYPPLLIAYAVGAVVVLFGAVTVAMTVLEHIEENQ
jgi:hypothetical protein